MGNTGRKTGGYLYNGRVTSGLRRRGFEIEEVVAGGASPEEQRTSAPRFGSTFDPSRFDTIVVDALARIAVAPHLDRWRASCPVVVLVHELPSVASGEPGTVAHEQNCEEPLLRADRFVAVSDHGRNVLLNRGVSFGNIHIVPPGFDRVTVGDAPARRGGPVRALSVAQWIERKGILGLIEAWTLHEREGAVLELIGETDADSGYAARVRDAIEAGPRASSIVVSGRVDDAALGAAYASADLFVLPSRYEGYGIVYAEALAHGLPIIACDVGPVPALVGQEAAFLVRPDDKHALSTALDLLLEDPRLRASMSAAATRRASHLPRWEDTVVGFEQVLRTAAESRKSGPM